MYLLFLGEMKADPGVCPVLCVQWHGCSLVFGVMDHVQQHLINDHSSGSSSQTQRCRWKNCEESFGARNSAKQVKLTINQ